MSVSQKQNSQLISNFFLQAFCPANQTQTTVKNQDSVSILESDHDLSLDGMLVSEEIYWDKYYTDTPYEWNSGRLEVKPLSDYLSNLLRNFFENLIREYLNLGIQFQKISYEVGFKMHLKNGKKIRKPDIGFMGTDSLQMQDRDCTY
jgi:hypothetical protein